MGILALTGPKHSGKTSLGKALARLGEGSFLDLDEVLQELSGQSPRELYLQGVQAFQAAETAAVRKALEKAEGLGSAWLYLACGGGIVDNGEAFSLLRSRAYLVYLHISAETAWERIERSAQRQGGLPPFLRTENPRETHRLLHERRAAQYAQAADLRLEGEGKFPPDLALTVINALTGQKKGLY